jgi:hypothetical protein
MWDKYLHLYQAGHQSTSTTNVAIPRTGGDSIEKVDSRTTKTPGQRFLSGSTSEMHGV